MSAATRRGAIGAILAAPLASVPALAAPITGERAKYRARLLEAFAEDRACSPISGNASPYSIEWEASRLITQRAWAVQREVACLPPPVTLEGLGLAALATALLHEGQGHNPEEPCTQAAVGLIRAVLAFTGQALPLEFIGFGDEPDHHERDQALFAAKGHLAPWAVAQAEAEAASCA